jgi:hypothetical protein
MYIRIAVIILLLALVVVPVLAQEDAANTLSFNGFSFSFDPALAANVNMTQLPGDPVESAGPGFSDAANTQFILYQPGDFDDSLFDTGGVRLYRMADIAQYDFLLAEVERVQGLLDERPELSEFEPAINDPSVGGLPYMPILTHGQTLTARAQYVETSAVTGISYLTNVSAALEPFTRRSFFYTFQGISADGEYYITVTIILDTALFDEALEGFDPAKFQEEWPTYLAESITTLNEAEPADFSPSLDLIDALVKSIAFE